MTDADAAFSEAYACLEQGLVYDDDNQFEEALTMYERGLNLFQDAEAFHDKESLAISELYRYLKEAEKSVQHRINVIKKESLDGSTPPPAYKSEKSEANQETKLAIRDQLDMVGSAEAELILCIPGGVQLFSIEDASTTAPTYPTALSVFKFPPRESSESTRPDAFIQVGPWYYPLYRGQTPVLCNEFGSFVVTNPTAEQPNLSVAIMLPADLDPKLRADFERTIGEYAVLRQASGDEDLTPEQKRKISERIARFLVKSGEKVAWVVSATSAKTASLVHQKSVSYRSGLQPTEKPMQLSSPVKGGVVYLHKGSKVVAKCTRYLLDRIGDVGIAVGRKVASGAKSAFGEGKNGGLVSGTFTVLGGGIAGASTVWIALEDASKTLCRSIADSTVDVVKVKYGDEASDATHHALYAAGHSTLAAAQLWDLGPRSIAGRMARKAGVQMVRDLDSKKISIAAIYEDPEKKKKL